MGVILCQLALGFDLQGFLNSIKDSGVVLLYFCVFFAVFLDNENDCSLCFIALLPRLLLAGSNIVSFVLWVNFRFIGS